jgi:hypothetical protein
MELLGRILEEPTISLLTAFPGITAAEPVFSVAPARKTPRLPRKTPHLPSVDQTLWRREAGLVRSICAARRVLALLPELLHGGWVWSGSLPERTGTREFSEPPGCSGEAD